MRAHVLPSPGRNHAAGTKARARSEGSGFTEAAPPVATERLGHDVNDDELMHGIAAGDENAFRLLVKRWERPVFAFLFHMLQVVDEAEDLCQETFIRVHKQAGRYRPEGKFKSWLFRIAGNLARSLLRRRKILRWVRFDAVQHDQQSSSSAPDRDLEQKQLQQIVRRALARLPDRQREAVVLRRYQDMSYREIAETLGTTSAAVESLLQRAATALRRDLAGKVELS
ncbi:MAG: RNA polymerase sigma factor [bacterium]